MCASERASAYARPFSVNALNVYTFHIVRCEISIAACQSRNLEILQSG